jgi:hypothetical protein
MFFNPIEANEVQMTLSQNLPNPFSNETRITVKLPEDVKSAYLALYDLRGKQVTSMPVSPKGSSIVILFAEKLEQGTYIYSLIADGKILDSKRMVVNEK